MSRWFTSDTHLMHEGIMRHEPEMRGGYKDVQEMTEEVIVRHNEMVRPNDIVFFLGDVALGKIADSLPMIAIMNGRKFLIPGNHDRIHPIMHKGKEAQIAKWAAEYLYVFKGILPLNYMTTLSHDPRARILMSHFPYEGDSHGEDRHAEYRPVDNGLPLVHGHVHSAWRTNGRQFNVGIDAPGANLGPTHEDEICEWLNTLD